MCYKCVSDQRNLGKIIDWSSLILRIQRTYRLSSRFSLYRQASLLSNPFASFVHHLCIFCALSFASFLHHPLHHSLHRLCIICALSFASFVHHPLHHSLHRLCIICASFLHHPLHHSLHHLFNYCVYYYYYCYYYYQFFTCSQSKSLRAR